MPRRAVAVSLFLVAVLAAACSSGSSAPTPTATITPTATPLPPTPPPQQRYEKLACPYDTPLGFNVECGYLTVKEKRSDPRSRNIKLAVVVVKSEAAQPRPDPIVYLQGGPGGSILETAPESFDSWFGDLLLERDIVLFDQRGVGRSEPALDCREFDEAFRDSAEQDVRGAALATMVADALTRCHERLAASGADLSGYNSAESAADLADLRLALGYREWNVYGISYGTRLALGLMRDHPQGIRSVVLDSTYTPDVDLYSELVPNAARAFSVFFAGCRADSSCNSQYPDLEGTFFRLVERLNRRPATVEAWNPATDERVQAKMNGDLLIGAVFQALYSNYAIEAMPGVIYEASDGNTDVLEPLLGDVFNIYNTISIGMHYSVQCVEEAPFATQAKVSAANQPHPRLRQGFESFEPIFAICNAWDVEPAAPKENQAVRSNIPTLVMAGEYDPITPPAWGELAAATLPNSFYYEYPGIGHGASVSDFCPYFMMVEFLDNPNVAPDPSCIAEMGGPGFY